MTSFSYVITDKDGIHARPAGLLAKMAANVKSDVAIKNGSKIANAKGIFAVMGLSVKCGDKVTVICNGPDETETAQKIEDFMKTNL